MLNNIVKKITTLSLVLVLGLGIFPTLSYANNGNGNGNGNGKNNSNQNSSLNRHDDDEDEDDDEDNDKSERKEQKEQKKEQKQALKACRKAFKNLFKSGNLGNNTASFYIECLRSVGFDAHFNGATSTPPVTDTLAPIITNLGIAPATTTATVTWHTNENADSSVFWSTSAGININSASNANESALIANHDITITGLSASTTYYLVVRSRDNNGNTATSSETSFHTTIPVPVVLDTTAPNISSLSTQVSSTTVQIGWNTNEPATSKIFYGTSSALDTSSSTSFVENVSLTLSHLVSFISLLPQTVYYFLVRSVDSSGNATTTPLLTATTTSI